MRISILGWYGKNNVGDEAFRAFMSACFEGHEFEFVTPPNRCVDPDIVVLGGGAVVSPFYLETLPNHCPRYALGVSIAYESEIDLLSNYGFEAVFVRNVSDVEPMRAKLRCPVEAVPDLAFYHPSPPLVEKNSRKKLGVFVTDYVNPAIDRPIKDFGKRAWSFTEVLARELDSLHEEYDVCLIPCSTGGYGNDRRINLDLAAFMKNEPINIMESLSPSRMIQTIGCLDLTLCMRFHAHIFSIIAGKPFLSIGFTRKVKLLLEENGIDGVEAGKFEEDEFRCENLRDKLTKVAATADVSSYLRIAAENRAKLETLIKRVRSEWLK